MLSNERTGEQDQTKLFQLPSTVWTLTKEINIINNAYIHSWHLTGGSKLWKRKCEVTWWKQNRHVALEGAYYLSSTRKGLSPYQFVKNNTSAIKTSDRVFQRQIWRQNWMDPSVYRVLKLRDCGCRIQDRYRSVPRYRYPTSLFGSSNSVFSVDWNGWKQLTMVFSGLWNFLLLHYAANLLIITFSGFPPRSAHIKLCHPISTFRASNSI